jgi:PAS domain S-box-containing protein
MRKIGLSFIIFFVICAFAYADKITINVGASSNPPFVHIGPDGTVYGIGCDLMKHVADKENFEINYVVGTWDEVLTKLDNNEIDVLFPVAYTKERALKYTFNEEAVFVNWGVIYSSQKERISNITDLEGKKVAVIQQDVYLTSSQGLQQLAESFNINIDYIYAPDYEGVIDLVEKGQASAGLVSRLAGQMIEQKTSLKRTQILISPVELRFAMPKDRQKSAVIAALLDRHIIEQKASPDSIIQKSLDKWLGIPSLKSSSLTSYLMYFIGISFGIIFLITLILKRKIKKAAAQLTETNEKLRSEIEERKLTQEKLKYSEEKYSSLFQTSAEPIIIIEESGVILDANNAVTLQMGYASTELIDKKIGYLISDFKLDEDLLKQIKDGNQRFERELYRKNGEKFDAEITTNSFTASETKLIQIVMRDITITKRTQQILAQKKKDLEKRVQEEIAYSHTQEQILMQQSKLAAMGQMINAIAHQWRQPLTTIGLYVQDVEDAFEYGELNLDYIQQFRDNCMEQVAYMSKTIDDFRNFFKPDKEKEIFYISEIMREVLSLINPQLINNNIEMQIFFKDTPVYIKGSVINVPTDAKNLTSYGYPNEFKQVLLNIIANARDAIIESRNGIDDEQGIIKITMQPDENDIIKLSIEDNGCGINDEIKERIFEPYFSTKDEGQGVGIGLYMSKIIIENNMEGRIYAMQKQKGSIFVIELKQWKLANIISDTNTLAE